MYEFNLPEEGLCSLHPTMPNDRGWRSCWCSRPNCNNYNNLRVTTPDIMSISMLPSNRFFGPYEAAYRM
ncbi:hypothetical protein RvY_12415 [Ramazzottius varieornatus]|uniref:Uncharacterized protein n=1 Tax=Ramazzottius varieornatus TaxID=947166 RepID=A0A1D1VLQ4_RAMVA|nr:hypothetical protein RvY_12415 [Ramazzottius varieornatus]